MDQKNGWGRIHYIFVCYDDPGWTSLHEQPMWSRLGKNGHFSWALKSMKLS